jgi:dihydroflavonol-4-reductase
VVLAAERGKSGQRYLLNGENVTANQLLQQVASIAGIRVPHFTPPTMLLHGLVRILELVSSIRGKPAPLTREVLQIIGRYAWYDASKARAELGWSSRPLNETLEDTIRWLRTPHSSHADTNSHERRAAVQ